MTELDLAVTGYANGGLGIARHNGRVVFVAGALPGERVRATLTQERTSFARASVVDVVDASPHRIDPLCPAAAAGAGCCDLSFATPDHARELGTRALSDVLARIGGFGDRHRPLPPHVEALDEDPTGWRVRTRLAVDPDGTIGLRSRGSAEIIAVPCAGPVDGLLDGVGGIGAAPGAELVVAAGADGRRHIVELAPVPAGGRRGGGRPGGRSGPDRRRRAQRSRAVRSAPRAERVIEGEAQVDQAVGERRWRIPVTGFWQAHRSAPGVYSRAAVDLLADAGVTGDVHVWDLYGGAGVFSGALCDADAPFTVTSVDLVDTDAGALVAAQVALADAPVTAHRGGVAETVAGLARPDLVISDPPRSGAGVDVVDAIVGARPRAVVHVGCDAAAFARDLGRFASQGYRVRAWRAFDAFPMTHHVEAMAVLSPG
ncbi:class I SAM-dependent RNA methyltransferase [Gordonia zhaorongruii]|uniref:class I SAM-dependent RNA methyltransferase n=1 Tax=Gordonia zhaorongruii TaxID=2597659 RepID=UPI00117DB144|nr:TRAM domain-containing protein [Gordonia zhaorongruii]